MGFVMWGMSAVGAVALVGGVMAAARRRPGPVVVRQRRIAAIHRQMLRDESIADQQLVRRLESHRALAGDTTVTCDARQELFALLEGRRFQTALARWPALRGVFRARSTDDALDEVEAVLMLLAERSAEEDFANHTDARLVELVRNHPYFASFSRRAPPGVRRFFELLNGGRYVELLGVWPEVVAGWWEDEGGQEQRRSVAHAPELHAVVRTLANRQATRAAA